MIKLSIYIYIYISIQNFEVWPGWVPVSVGENFEALSQYIDLSLSTSPLLLQGQKLCSQCFQCFLLHLCL